MYTKTVYITKRYWIASNYATFFNLIDIKDFIILLSLCTENITRQREDMEWKVLLVKKTRIISSISAVYFCTNNSAKAGNDAIDILTSEDIETMPLESRM